MEDCEGQSHKTVSKNHNIFEEKGEESGIEPRPDRLTPQRGTQRDETPEAL